MIVFQNNSLYSVNQSRYIQFNSQTDISNYITFKFPNQPIQSWKNYFSLKSKTINLKSILEREMFQWWSKSNSNWFKKMFLFWNIIASVISQNQESICFPIQIYPGFFVHIKFQWLILRKKSKIHFCKNFVFYFYFFQI
jgi:hypothetical protein